MKYLNYLLLLVMVVMLSNCTTKCKKIQKSEVIVLPDVSDKQLFQIIRQDIQANFGNFMARSGLGVTEPCQQLTLRTAPVAAREELNLTSQSIQVTQTGLSIQEQQQQASPAPLVSMLKTRLDEYEKLTDDKENTASSTIINTLLKAILQTDPDAESTIVLMTDGVEFNSYVNLYKHIPATDEIPDVIEKLIDPEILTRFKAFQQQSVNPKVIVILKAATPPAKVNNRAVKSYWIEMLKELKLTNTEFADNLNTVN